MRISSLLIFGALVFLARVPLRAQEDGQRLVLSYRRSSAGARGPTDIPVGARVRVRLTDTLVQLGGERPIGAPPIFEGTLLAIDSSSMQVRLDHAWRFDVPATGVGTLEVRTGPGWCRESRGTRALCVTGGTLASLAIGLVGARTIGQQVATLDYGSYTGAVRRRWTVFGVAAGVGLAALEVPRLARDRWERVSGWTLGFGGS